MMYFLNRLNRLYKLIALGIVGILLRLELLYDLLFVYTQIIAQCIQRRIKIAELQIEKTCQHMRIFRQHFFPPFGIIVL